MGHPDVNIVNWYCCPPPNCGCERSCTAPAKPRAAWPSGRTAATTWGTESSGNRFDGACWSSLIARSEWQIHVTACGTLYEKRGTLIDANLRSSFISVH